MVELRDRRILIDGKPVLLFAGEIHYFRLKRDEWQDRVRKAKELGCNAIASYMPWVVHEQREGAIDVQDIADFIDLCHQEGLWFIARPGPFVMAEMKNEGVPHWVYAKYPDAVPVSWKGDKAITPTLDYLHPGYLTEVDRWYGAVMPLLADRIQSKGGPVIGVQLDNEIGMLQWVTNQPDLSDDTLCDFAKWIVGRYGNDRYPFDLNDPQIRAQELRDPKPEIGPRLLQDYGDYERDRFARYVGSLRSYAEKHGVRDVPFIVNIHGSGGGRGTAFPIGIHQLFETYQSQGYLSGSDHYLGELTRQNAPDLYFINAFMAAVAPPWQPISSMEFEVGTGDYGETGAVRMSGAAADFKARLSVAQGNRLINYYLLAGGRNPHLLDRPEDGNGRIAVTGERHGFAAPIDPEGKTGSNFVALQRTTQSMLAVVDKLADMDEEHDDLALAFVPDYYKTDLHRPGPMREIVQGLEGIRGNLESLVRNLLFLGYRFPAVDIQNRPITAGCLVFASSRYLDEPTQRKLADFVENGGKLLLYGEVPRLDFEGRPCTVLADAIGLRHKAALQASGKSHLSLKGENWAQSEPEVRNWQAETFEVEQGEVFLRVVGSGDIVGATTQPSGKGGFARVLGVNYTAHLGFHASLVGGLAGDPGIRNGFDGNDGLILTSVSNRRGERFLTAINLDDEEREIRPMERGETLFRFVLPGRQARLLPVGVQVGPVRIVYSTAEIERYQASPPFIHFRETGREEHALLETDVELKATEATASLQGREVRLTIPAGGASVSAA